MPSLLIRILLAAALAVAVASPAAATTMIKRMPLEEVTGEAVRIVHGTVTAVDVGRDVAGAPATWVTLEVARTVKGAVGSSLTIKQLGVAAPLPDGTVTRIPGMPRYVVGEEVVLFLRADSGSGFTSPVGFEQGVYRVTQGVARSAARGEVEPLDAFLDKVERLGGWAK